MWAVVIVDPDYFGVQAVVDVIAPFNSIEEAEAYAKSEVDGVYVVTSMSCVITR
jgi:hypothetical protein